MARPPPIRMPDQATKLCCRTSRCSSDRSLHHCCMPDSNCCGVHPVYMIVTAIHHTAWRATLACKSLLSDILAQDTEAGDVATSPAIHLISDSMQMFFQASDSHLARMACTRHPVQTIHVYLKPRIAPLACASCAGRTCCATSQTSSATVSFRSSASTNSSGSSS